ncbi:hypothetical protein PQX77_016819 [Marasmius sp. AFHP31]|nr:hypothetical protein PQX77_016819 [Marasmius sp. AFHP31]
MPNSAKPFHITWASAVQLPTAASSTFSPSVQSQSHAQQHYPTEYSIFVGDLAPETSNSDLVAVFRNPVLGLRNDREPKFIRPFLSCKSAKIMLDPVTGVSRGYGFVRFTDEADQQRALIEMHGLYCLSRPMRISPATAKFKPPASAAPTQPPPFHISPQQINSQQPLTLSLPPHGSNTPGGPNPPSLTSNTANIPNQPKSVSSPIAATAPVVGAHPASMDANYPPTDNSGPGSGTSSSVSNGSLASTATAFSSGGSDSDVKSLVQQVSSQQFAGVAGPTPPDGKSASHPGYPSAQGGQGLGPAPTDSTSSTKYLLTEESWKHHAQARAILGNLIGPNGEQLTITDPYNTTVFVGGLSPLINEDTLRTFFAPFGDIHYVKVPVGKNCGFVQFVRKADAEKAIEKMQGFPIGGSRIRLSWGRSQYKAAQAAAQAAQAAAMQLQNQYGIPSNPAGATAVPPSLANIHPLLQSMQGQGPNAPSNPASQNQQHTVLSQAMLSGIDISSLTQDQAIQLLWKLSAGGHMDLPIAADERQHGRQMDMNGFNSAEHQQAAFAPNAANLSQQRQNEQMNIASLHHHLHSPGAGLYAEEKLRSAHLASREDAIGPNSQLRQHLNHPQSQLGGMFDHSLYSFNHPAGAGDRRPTILGGSSFSPFSPDPNGTSTPNGDHMHGSLPRRESVVSTGSVGGMNTGHVHGLSLSQHGSNSSSPAPLGNSLAPKGAPTTARTASSLSRYGSFSGPSQGIGSSIPSPVSATANGGVSGRTSTGGAVISRPNSGQPYQHQQQHPSDSFDAMHDLNGTLASLDLDSSPNPVNVGSPTNASFSALRPLSQFGGNTWGMSVSPHPRSGLKSPAADTEASGSPDSKQYLSSSNRGDEREGLRAVSPM